MHIVISIIYSILLANSQYGSISLLPDRTQIRRRAAKIHKLIILITIHNPQPTHIPTSRDPSGLVHCPSYPHGRAVTGKERSAHLPIFYELGALVGFMFAHEKGQTLI